MLKNKIIILLASVDWVCGTVLRIFPHWIGSLNLVFENTRIIPKRATVQDDSLKIFVHIKVTMYVIVNWDNTINVTLSGVVNWDIKQH